MEQPDLDAIEARANAALNSPTGQSYDAGVILSRDVHALVTALREVRVEVERLRGPFPCCEHCVEYPDDDPHLDGVKDQHDLPCQICESWRDDWRRRYEALRDGVTRLCDERDTVDELRFPNSAGAVPTSHLRAVVARVEGDES